MGEELEELELTILMPCLNEEKTIETCIIKAYTFINSNNIKGEVLIADNGSTDKSVYIAKKNGARVVEVKEKGYGHALIEGSKSAKGKYTIMGDCDDSYNFLELDKILEKLRQGEELVIGNRYKGTMEKGAMKKFHQYVGTPIISAIGRAIYNVKAGDFNCGLRGYQTKKMNELHCKCGGMEYATEMIIRAKKNNLKICEVPINFYKDGRDRKSHLRPIQDGIRHIKTIIFLK